MYDLVGGKYKVGRYVSRPKILPRVVSSYLNHLYNIRCPILLEHHCPS